MSYLIDFLSQILTWLVDLFLWLPRMVLDAFLLGALAGIESIPVPAWLAGATFGDIDPGIAYFATAFQIPTGVGIILGAYAVRFVIRRLPIVG